MSEPSKDQLIRLMGSPLNDEALAAVKKLRAAGWLEDGSLQGALLPDGTKLTSNDEVRRFLFPDHPEFWRSDDPHSPAYRGADDPDDPGYEEHKSYWPDD